MLQSSSFLSSPHLHSSTIGLVRIIIGLLLLYHGWEVFNPTTMQGYFTWDAFKGPLGPWWVYAGKIAELLAGLSLFLGLFTRMGALLGMGTLAYVTFFVGQGRFWYEDQHPFLFVLFCALFLGVGAGRWSLDALLFSAKG